MKTSRENGRYGRFGGRYVPETLFEPLLALEAAWNTAKGEAEFQTALREGYRDIIGRPTPLTRVRRWEETLAGPKVFLKREDLAHTGAHKINNAFGQALLAKRMGKSRIVAETGAGQHGVATATVCALLGLKCVVYMGARDMNRQAMNVLRMKMLGAEVRSVNAGQQTLKEAVSEALRDWVTEIHTTYYLIGSALGPHPYPAMVKAFQKIIGEEARGQILEATGKLPTELVACVGGGSNAIGLFAPFLEDSSVKMTGVEAGGTELAPGRCAARFEMGSPGVLQGTYTYLLQDEAGQVLPTQSVSAGLDYPAVGPEHAALYESGRVQYTSVSDSEALSAAKELCLREGVLPALESAHALAYVKRVAKGRDGDIFLVNLSGRGDKDLETYQQAGLGDAE